MQEIQEAIRQISLNLKSLDEGLEQRAQTVDRVMRGWEQKLTGLLAESRDAIQEMKDLRDSLHWKRRTLITMVLTGFLGGVALLLLSLSLPGANQIMYKLLLILGR